jgi:hypothetical protein
VIKTFNSNPASSFCFTYKSNGTSCCLLGRYNESKGQCRRLCLQYCESLFNCCPRSNVLIWKANSTDTNTYFISMIVIDPYTGPRSSTLVLPDSPGTLCGFQSSPTDSASYTRFHKRSRIMPMIIAKCPEMACAKKYDLASKSMHKLIKRKFGRRPTLLQSPWGRLIIPSLKAANPASLYSLFSAKPSRTSLKMSCVFWLQSNV